MGELSARNFGLVIAYLVPGFVAVIAVSGLVPTIQPWLAMAPDGQPTVGGFLFVTLASIAAGMLVSSIRWLLLDSIHHRTGIRHPKWDFSQLQENLAAYNLLVEFHYRYYQFNANTFVAVLLAYGSRLAGGCQWCGGPGWVDAGFVIVEAVLFATSRDTLRKYYVRVSQVLKADTDSGKEKSNVEWRRTLSRTRLEAPRRTEAHASGANSSERAAGNAEE